MKDQKNTSASTVVLEDVLGETQNPSPIDLEKWKKAVIHLECATDSKSLDEQMALWDDLSKKLEKREITPLQAAEGMQGGKRDIRYRGTAIFFKHDSRRYLITARHVLYDEVGAANELKIIKRRHSNLQLDIYIETLKQTIFPIIFQVPSLDTVLKEDISRPGKILMNLGAGGGLTYIFSQEVDLAIISLDQRNADFAGMLVSRGYEPIQFEDIAEQPSSEGTSVFSVGFPDPISTLAEQKLHPALKLWASSGVSLPTFVFGRVAMLHDSLSDFRCDFTNYQGNSGAPVIEKNRMVGVVTCQPFYEASVLQRSTRTDADFVSKIRVPFAVAVKAEYIKELLKLQIDKDRRNSWQTRRNQINK